MVQAAIDIKVLQTLGMARETRSHARVASEGPSPTVNGEDFLGVTVARGPVPRDLSTATENARSPETTDVCCSDRAWRGTGPRPTVKAAIKHGEGQVFPPPYVKERRFFHRSAGDRLLDIERFMKHPH